MTNQDYMLQKIKETILSFDRNAEIILYGSRAKGTASSDSDWDFLALTDADLDNFRKREIRNAVYSIELETGEIISIIIHSKEYWYRSQNTITPFYKNVGKECITL
jgi:predicted nucleotidyltransferase